MTLQEAFQFLNLTLDANRAEIRHTYSELSKIYHVETHPEEFSRLHEAYKLALAQAAKPHTEQNSISENQKSQEKNSSDTDKTSEEHLAEQDSLKQQTKIQQILTLKNFSSDTDKTSEDHLAEQDSLKQQTETDQIYTQKKNSSCSEILDQLFQDNFDINNYGELTQLLYYKCRYDEISSDLSAVLLRITNAEKGFINDPFHPEELDQPFPIPNSKPFFSVPWSTWKCLNWTAIISYPSFFGTQYNAEFLKELYLFLQEETRNCCSGISQELFFSLCMAYDFFYKESSEKDILSNDFTQHHPLDFDIQNHKNKVEENSKITSLAKIKNLLLIHPKRQEYCQDLKTWQDCQKEREIVLLCRELYQYFILKNNPSKTLLDTAEELLLADHTFWKEFIYDNFSKLNGILPHKMQIRKHEFLQLKEQKENFRCDFFSILDGRIAGNYIDDNYYKPLIGRIKTFKKRYLKHENWKKLVCNESFFQALKEFMLPNRNGYISTVFMLPYEVWKTLRIWFSEDTLFEKKVSKYLSEEFFFPEYEKRYQRECLWDAQNAKTAYFKEIFPIAELSQGKMELLKTIWNGTSCRHQKIQKIWGNLTGYNEEGADFLIRLTNALTHFKFLVVTPKHEKDAVPGDAFCFLKDKVILYRKKENLTCYLSHQFFYDILARKLEGWAYSTLHQKTNYSDKFLDTVCKNMYYYRCYIDTL